MDDWDQETLEKVVQSKSKEYNKNKPTDIVSPLTMMHFTSYFKYISWWDESVTSWICSQSYNHVSINNISSLFVHEKF